MWVCADMNKRSRSATGPRLRKKGKKLMQAILLGSFAEMTESPSCAGQALARVCHVPS